MIEELYQDIILDHNRRPRNFGALEGANGSASGYNPLCGDGVKIQLLISGDKIEDIRFEGQGCAISVASASMMTERLKGLTREEAERLFSRFHGLLTEGEARENGDGPDLGDLAAFSGVRKFPIRVKCATLPWHAFKAALEDATSGEPARNR